MTDDQIMTFVQKEMKSGTSQAQIVTKLMQKGVDISQIRRIRQKYERQSKNTGMGLVDDETVKNADETLRTNNGDTKETIAQRKQQISQRQQEKLSKRKRRRKQAPACS